MSRAQKKWVKEVQDEVGKAGRGQNMQNTGDHIESVFVLKGWGGIQILKIKIFFTGAVKLQVICLGYD